MNEMMIFSNPEFGKLRSVEIDGEVWFVGKDVATALGYKDTVNALKSHVDDDDKRGWQITTPSGKQNMTIINESGVYSLILSSKLPNAKKFKHWITSEVLPSIRKTGAYMEEDIIHKMIDSPEFGIELLTALKEEKLKSRKLEAVNSELVVDKQILQPKADYFDELVERNTLTSFRDTAKQLGVKEKSFVSFLLEKKYIYRDKKGKLMPYADKNDGLFEVKECFNEKTQWSGTQTLVTPKGRETFRLLCLKAG